MDRGRDQVGGPDDVEAATDDDGIEPARAPDDGSPGDGLTAAEELRAGGSAADPADPADLADAAVAADMAVAADDDERPAVWLADIRARAPWLLGPGGALRWRVAGPPGPDRVPHGMAPTEPRWGAEDSSNRTEAAGIEPGTAPLPIDGRGIRPSIESGAGDAGSKAGTTSSDRDPRSSEPAEPADTAPDAAEPASRPGTPRTVEADADHGAPDRVLRQPFPPSWPALDSPRVTAGPDPFAPADDPDPAPHDPWPDPDPRRPAIRRSSTTWSQSRARPAASSPVWPPRPHPEAAGLPHQGPVAEPSRPMHRPVAPFTPDRPGPASPATHPPRPIWAEDGSGWHAAAVSPARIVDEAALPPWPSLLDDDDDGDDEPDWAALERTYDRMLRLDREQRRR